VKTLTAAPRPPSVERVLAAIRERLGERDHDAVLTIARDVVAAERDSLATGEPARSVDELAAVVAERLDAFVTGPEAAINATGVLLHTNLGRAPWPEAAVQAAAEAARGASLLELDGATGRRGRRFRGAEEHLIALTGAEDALVVNNNAAAVAIAVGLASRAGVAVSRGELVEIGGGVRIPEVVRRAGARLVEVGTTNRTRVADFEAVLVAGRVRLVLRVHPSNFVQSGFVEAPDAFELAALAHRYGAIVVDDLGSGALLDTARFGLAHEPTPAERLAAGADLVTFSGDKLLGGPQAGFVVGRGQLIAKLRRDPLARAMRADKVLLAAVAATLGLYRAGRALKDVPIWRRIGATVDELDARAQAIEARGETAGVSVEVVPSTATIGGGSLPGQTLESRALRLRSPHADGLLGRLRAGRPSVIGRIEDHEVLLDLRTVDPSEDETLATAVVAALRG
jgi:L-seryl-tRNA(Ser) seleniumtransferase